MAAASCRAPTGAANRTGRAALPRPRRRRREVAEVAVGKAVRQPHGVVAHRRPHHRRRQHPVGVLGDAAILARRPLARVLILAGRHPGGEQGGRQGQPAQVDRSRERPDAIRRQHTGEVGERQQDEAGRDPWREVQRRPTSAPCAGRPRASAGGRWESRRRCRTSPRWPRRRAPRPRRRRETPRRWRARRGAARHRPPARPAPSATGRARTARRATRWRRALARSVPSSTSQRDRRGSTP